jgi:hypothetical protein
MQGLLVAVVTFSSQVTLISQILKHAFPAYGENVITIFEEDN